MDHSLSSIRRAILTLTVLVVLAVAPVQAARPAVAQDAADPPSATVSPILVDNFESYPVGEFPDDWIFVTSTKEIRSYAEMREPGEEIYVEEEDGNQFMRVITRNEAVRYTQRNGKNFDWSIERHPRIEWRWRALTLPEGASEKGKNDTGGALYVTFGEDWIGRPKSIKYSYSSSLPVGTVVSFGPLKVIVVDSANEPGTGKWKTVQRNIIHDYRQVFGGTPPDRPISITVWGDSDTTQSESKVDFDDIKFLPPYQRDR